MDPTGPTAKLDIRAVEDRDADRLVQLIARCFADYPGCILECDTEETELKAPASRFETFWIAEAQFDDVENAAEPELVGCIGCTPGTDADGVPGLELKKLYVHPDLRRAGLGRRLVDLVEAHARETTESPRVFLWSDVRFITAHAVYEHLGYSRTPHVRELHDLSATVEYHFVKQL